MSKRKITATLPVTLAMRMDEVVQKHLGIPRNHFLAMSVAFMLARLAPMLTAKKRVQVLRDVKKVFDDIMDESNKAV